MSIVERYHQSIPIAHTIIKSKAPDAPEIDALQMAVTSENDSFRSHVLVPTVIFYGTLSRLGRHANGAHPSQVKRLTTVR